MGADYNRGYNRGRSLMERRIEVVLRFARRLRTTEREHFGCANWTQRECRNCARWTRGGEKCLWGWCSAEFEPMAGEPSMWVDTDGASSRICTHENFGCVNWLHPKVSGESVTR